MSKLLNDYKQYGLIGLLSRIIKSILRRIGISYEQYYYMVNDIDYERQVAIWNKKPISGVKVLTYDDFLLGDKSVFTPSKLALIKNRLNKGYYAYGIVENNELIYSCWLSTKELQVNAGNVSFDLTQNECLMVDAYCPPKARGKGYHSQMNAYRLMQTVNLGRKKCIVVVLKENIPAFKSQIKVGYKVEFMFYICKIGNKVYTDFYKKRGLLN